jgi:hypothetical protein
MDESFIITSSNTTETINDPALVAGVIMSFFIITLIFIVILYVFSAICLGRIFKKAGKESWPAWVPFYNNWILFELGDQKGYFSLFFLIPSVGSIIYMVFLFIAMYHIGLKLGKSGVFILWGIFLAPVWYVWLAFDKSKWNENPTPAIIATNSQQK